MKNHVSSSTLRTSVLIAFATVLHSCGSFQPTSYYASDGIYADDDQVQDIQQNSNSNSEAFSQYFNEKSKEYNWDDTQDGVYLTETDDYVSNQNPQGQWGSAPQSTNIYVIGSPIDYSYGYLGFNSMYNGGFGYGNFGGRFFGNNSLLYNPFRWGTYNPHYMPYAYGFYNPYYGGFYPSNRFNWYNQYNGFNQYNGYNVNSSRFVGTRIQPKRRAYSNSRRGTTDANNSNGRDTRSAVSSKRRVSPNIKRTVAAPEATNSTPNSPTSNTRRIQSEEDIRVFAQRFIVSRQNNNQSRNVRQLESLRNSSNSKNYKPSTRSNGNSASSRSAPSVNTSIRSRSSNTSARSSSPPPRTSSRSSTSNRKN